MYQKIATNGIVLRKSAHGEANLRVAVLTEALGLVNASARSARRQESKLRYGLEPLTMARFCFVRGVHEWRIAEASAPHKLFPAVDSAPPSPGLRRANAGRVSQLLLRLIHGQEPSPLLYKDVAEGFALLASQKSTEEIEVVLVLRILSHLGYLPRTEELAPFVDGQFGIELSARALASRALLVRAINDALQTTGL